MTRAVGFIVAAAALTLPLWLASAYHVHVAIMAGIFGVLALSLNLLLGFTGQLSLGHAAFFGIGAYTSALLTLKAEWPFWPALAVAVALAGAAGWLIGRLALKLRGAYFVLVTISFAGVISLVSVNWTDRSAFRACRRRSCSAGRSAARPPTITWCSPPSRSRTWSARAW
jgi:branched-chain amino acid transport system permease protein